MYIKDVHSPQNKKSIFIVLTCMARNMIVFAKVKYMSDQSVASVSCIRNDILDIVAIISCLREIE